MGLKMPQEIFQNPGGIRILNKDYLAPLEIRPVMSQMVDN